MKSSVKPTWIDFDHRFKARLEFLGMAELMRKQRLCVALSGGADSVGLLLALKRLREALDFELHAAHFHHGPGENIDFREQALSFCQVLCADIRIPFYFEKHKSSELKSEADFREARWAFLRSLRAEGKVDFLVTGHHAEDQLETRLLNLLRGCGPEGLQAMSEIESVVLRPFLQLSKKEILGFLEQINGEFLQDPSNSQAQFKRNWLRLEWLPLAEGRQTGSIKGLARSLENIAEAFKHQKNNESTLVWLRGDWKNGLDRRQFFCLSPSQQKQVLVSYLRLLGTHDFRHTQIEEIIKNLDSPQIVHKFTVLRLKWQVNAEQILAYE